MRQWIDKLREERTLRPEEFRQLLTECDGESLRYINKQAQEVSLRHFGNRIFIRGLIEVSNCCRNNCYYCGIRKGNPNLERYRLSTENILNCCKQGYGLGFRTFVLQGGEDPALTEERIEDIVSTIRRSYPDCAITLSLGEKSRSIWTDRLCSLSGSTSEVPQNGKRNAEIHSIVHVLWIVHFVLGRDVWRIFRRFYRCIFEGISAQAGHGEAGMVCTVK